MNEMISTDENCPDVRTNSLNQCNKEYMENSEENTLYVYIGAFRLEAGSSNKTSGHSLFSVLSWPSPYRQKLSVNHC